MTPITETVIADYIAAIYTALDDRLTAQEQNTISSQRRDHYYIDIPFLGKSALLLCDYYRLLITPAAPAQVHYLIRDNPALYVTSANENEGGERYSRIYIDTPERLLDCKPILRAIYDAQKQNSLKKKPALIGFQRAFAEAANIPWALEALAPDMETITTPESRATDDSAEQPDTDQDIVTTAESTTSHEKKRDVADPLAIYTVFDLETTGLDPNTDEIIEISAIRVENGQQVAEFSALVQPTDHLVSLDITQLTGITNDMLTGKPTIETVMPRFLEFIGDTPLVGHNICAFDLLFCNRACAQIGCPRIENQCVDTLPLARRHLKLKNYRLGTIASAFHVIPDTAHRALADCQTTMLCFEALKKLQAAPLTMQQATGRRAKQTSPSGKAKISAGDYKKFAQVPKAKDIHPTRTEFDPNHPLFGKTCVFSGDLETMNRETAMQRTVDVGGLCADNITKATDFLIADLSASRKTTKQKKAEAYIAQGLAIKIIAETEFLALLDQKNAQLTFSISQDAE